MPMNRDHQRDQEEVGARVNHDREEGNPSASRARLPCPHRAAETERLTVNRTNVHIYASVISAMRKVIVSASTVEPEVRTQLASAKGRGATSTPQDCRYAHRTEGEGGWHRERGFRPRGPSIPRPGEGAAMPRVKPV